MDALWRQLIDAILLSVITVTPFELFVWSASWLIQSFLEVQEGGVVVVRDQSFIVDLNCRDTRIVTIPRRSARID